MTASIRSIIVLAALCLAPLARGTAQQSADAAGTTAPVTQAAATPAPSGPRVTPPIQREEPVLAPARSSATTAYHYKENHTIVLSTLALVLAVVLIVVLIIR